MPIYRLSKIYKKLKTTKTYILLWDKKLKCEEKILKTDSRYKEYLTKPTEFYILKLLGD